MPRVFDSAEELYCRRRESGKGHHFRSKEEGGSRDAACDPTPGTARKAERDKGACVQGYVEFGGSAWAGQENGD